MLNHYFKLFQFLILPYTLKIKILFFSFWIITFFYILAFPSRFNLAFAGSASLTWTAPTTNADGTTLTDLAGFKVYYGTSSGNYGAPIDIGNQTSYTVAGLGAGTYYFSVTAYNTSGNESTVSSEGSKTIIAASPLISGIGTANITATGATVTWTTDIPADSQVEYGTTAAYGTMTALNSTLATSHSQTLTGLQGATTYHFRVKSSAGGGNLSNSGDNIFTTSSGSGSGGSSPPPGGNLFSGPSSSNIAPQQTPAAGGCGIIKLKGGKSPGPGQGADMFAILSGGLLFLLRKTLKGLHFQRSLS